MMKHFGGSSQQNLATYHTKNLFQTQNFSPVTLNYSSTIAYEFMTTETIQILPSFLENDQKWSLIHKILHTILASILYKFLPNIK